MEKPMEYAVSLLKLEDNGSVSEVFQAETIEPQCTVEAHAEE